MTRDHLLGFPPALLALDPEPPHPSLRTPVPQKLSAKEQEHRRFVDITITQALKPCIKQSSQSSAIAIRVRVFSSGRISENVYTLRDNGLYFWNRIYNEWRRVSQPDGPTYNWNNMKEAPPSYLAELPPEAFK